MTSVEDRPAKSGGVLGAIERFGNRLPDPVFIFIWLIAFLVALSVVAAAQGWRAVNPATHEELVAKSLLTEENLRLLFTEMPKTLTSFPPLGLVLTVMLGAIVAERSGLFSALLRAGLRNAPKSLLTPSVLVIGTLAHHASDAAYVVYIPLAAIIYASAGRHPLAGIATAFAAVSGGFAGNFIPGQTDVLLLGISEPAARLLDPTWTMNPLANWYFCLTIVFIFTPIAWAITDLIIEPRLGPWRAQEAADAPAMGGNEALTDGEKRGMRRAGVAALIIVALFAALAAWPGFTPLYDEGAEGAQRLTPFYRGLIAGFFLLFLSMGWAFGSAAGTVKSHRDIVAMMIDGMKTMGPYLVIAFFAAHFVAMFNWSNLGPIIAIRGAAGLQSIALPAPLILICVLLMSSGLDLFIGSASAKWSMLAPVVVPMLMLLGISPDMTTAAYRMGDSVTNIVTPLMSYFPLVLAFCQRWKSDFGLGSLLATMIPYGAAFMTAGLLMVGCWVGFDLPVGPGAAVHYALPAAK